MYELCASTVAEAPATSVAITAMLTLRTGKENLRLIFECPLAESCESMKSKQRVHRRLAHGCSATAAFSVNNSTEVAHGLMRSPPRSRLLAHADNRWNLRLLQMFC